MPRPPSRTSSDATTGHPEAGRRQRLSRRRIPEAGGLVGGGGEHALAVRAPAADDVGAGVPGQALRRTAVQADDVDIGVAVVAGREGDLLAVRTAGAYGFTMASNYNTRPMPAEILVDGSTAKVVRKRQTLEDVIAGES